MKGEDHSLELGSKSFIDTFEEQLVGSKVGDKKTISVTFPKDYHAADLAGKKAAFDVEVKELRQHKPVELNDASGQGNGFSRNRQIARTRLRRYRRRLQAHRSRSHQTRLDGQIG